MRSSVLRAIRPFRRALSVPNKIAVSPYLSFHRSIASSARAAAVSRATPSASTPVNEPGPETPNELSQPLLSTSETSIPPTNNGVTDWSSSFHGLGAAPFEPRIAEILLRPVNPDDVEIKPDGIIYLPEIKYRRILNEAFGPGGWGLAPRGELIVGDKVVTREYALVAHGRLVAIARGEMQYFNEESIPTAGEGCKSNALMRCCKDIGIASELWDPQFIRKFKKTKCHEVWVEHVVSKKKRQIWVRRDCEPTYPYKKSS
ncbi:hypothetical protein VTK73DRAFT_8248 [Phialemonium thermophilum]|uniref:Mitochondrial genome maintenance protein MGM101 n=1 Tax=Phialemonium thermophilum TaxID=223376 RepID=A0ABR3XQN0_9PEZI